MSSSTKILKLYRNLLEVAVLEFKTVVESGEILYSQSNEPWKLRLYLCDSSLIDVHFSIRGKYSFHWDRRLTTNKIYRHDNAPHQRWKDIATFPKHFHNGSEDTVVPSHIPDNPELALREFLSFAVRHIAKEQG